MGKAPSWTAEEDDLLRQHTAEGVNRMETARMLGRSVQAVRHHARRLRVGRAAPGASGTAWPAARLLEAAKLRDQGWPLRQIAARFGGSVTALHYALKRLARRASAEAGHTAQEGSAPA